MFSIFRYLVSQQFLILFFVFVQASAVKPGICNLFLSYCFLMLSSKRRFSNPAFKNSCSNPYFWGVKTRVSKFGFLNSGFQIRVSKFGFKTDIENPKLEKLNFWSTLIGPLSKISKCSQKFKIRRATFILTYRISSYITCSRDPNHQNIW